ncbi:unnamed protein product [Dicrocoelium dendriticum]|nr:unnamed protein product [Dicrocoelium dendriticum]
MVIHPDSDDQKYAYTDCMEDNSTPSIRLRPIQLRGVRYKAGICSNDQFHCWSIRPFLCCSPRLLRGVAAHRLACESASRNPFFSLFECFLLSSVVYLKVCLDVTVFHMFAMVIRDYCKLK